MKRWGGIIGADMTLLDCLSGHENFDSSERAPKSYSGLFCEIGNYWAPSFGASIKLATISAISSVTQRSWWWRPMESATTKMT